MKIAERISFRDRAANFVDDHPIPSFVVGGIGAVALALMLGKSQGSTAEPSRPQSPPPCTAEGKVTTDFVGKIGYLDIVYEVLHRSSEAAQEQCLGDTLDAVEKAGGGKSPQADDVIRVPRIMLTSAESSRL